MCVCVCVCVRVTHQKSTQHATPPPKTRIYPLLDLDIPASDCHTN